MKKSKIWMVVLIASVISFIAGVTLANKLSVSAAESKILVTEHEIEKQLYKCGSAGDIDCFKQAYLVKAIFNKQRAEALLERGYPGETADMIKTIEVWNTKIAEGGNE